jgi:tripartite-type tricarboxylate transporter receptor subunit TctC
MPGQPGRRAVLGLGTALLASPALASRRNAVELIVGAPAGSATDRWTRGAAPFLERAWPRVAITVRNHPGRAGLEALALLAEARPDQKMIGVLTTPLLLARAVEAGEVSPLERVAPLASVIEESMVLVGSPTSGPHDIAGLRALGERGTLGTAPAGSAAHFAAMRLTGRMELARLAFPSAAAARQAAASGHVAAAMLALPDAINGLREGKLLALGIATPGRSTLLPDTPTLREQGVDLVASTRRGFSLNPAAPEGFRAALLRALEAMAADQDFVAQAESLGQSARFLGPEAWGRVLARADGELRRLWAEEAWLPRRA